MSRIIRIALVSICACSALASRALAADAQASGLDVSFAAFGTLSVVHSSEEHADFVHTAAVRRGAGASAGWAADVDSLLGAQLTVAAGSKLSAIVQVVTEHNYDNSYRPHVEWANLKYEFTPGFALRVGRIALPIFSYTEARKVGFALPWVRTPHEVYEMIPVTANDGVDLTWQGALGPGVNIFQLAVGKSSTRFVAGQSGRSEAKTDDQFTVANTYELGGLSLRANYGQAHVRIDQLGPLFDAFRQFGPAGAALADRYDLDGDLARYMGASIAYDPGRWRVAGEWGRLESDSFLGERQGWYLQAGVRFGRLTPYVTFGEVDVEDPSSPGLDAAALPPALAPVVAQLNASLNAVLGDSPRQATATVGLRWDALRNVAVKAQYDRIDLGRGSAGTLNNVQPGFVPGGVVHLLSLSVDFVL